MGSLLIFDLCGHYPPLNGSLPNLATIFVGTHHRITCPALEGGSELRQVRQWSIDAELSQWVRVDVDQQACEFGSRVGGPTAGIAQKETLLRPKAINHRVWFAGQ